MPIIVLALLFALVAAGVLAAILVRILADADRSWTWPAVVVALIYPLALAIAVGAVRSKADALFFILVGMALAVVVWWALSLSWPAGGEPPPREPGLRSSSGPVDDPMQGDLIGSRAGQGLVLRAGTDPTLAFGIQNRLREVLERQAPGRVVRRRADGLELRFHRSTTTRVYIAFLVTPDDRIYVWAGGGLGDTGEAFGGFDTARPPGGTLGPADLPAAIPRTVRSKLIPDADMLHEVRGFLLAHETSTPPAVELDGSLRSARVSEHVVVVGCYYEELRLFVALQVVGIRLAPGGGEDVGAILDALTERSLRVAVQLDQLARLVISHLGPETG